MSDTTTLASPASPTLETSDTTATSGALSDALQDSRQDQEIMQMYQEAEQRQHHPINSRAGCGKPLTAAPAISRGDTSLDGFLQKTFPPAEALIEGLLNRREFAALIGRRRHGKTTFLLNMTLKLADGNTDYVGYHIPKSRRVVIFLLEDDPGELQEKLRALLGSKTAYPNVHIVTKEDFYSRTMPIDVNDQKFRSHVQAVCRIANPDVIVFDNLTHIVRADYNDSKKIDSLVRFVYELQQKFNAAVVIAAHPRKRGAENIKVALDQDAEGFFEQCMGSSHFINSAGTLWGIERAREKEKTYFVGGTQRRDGSQSMTPLEMVDGWFEATDDFQDRLNAALTTMNRVSAWNVLPEGRLFKRAEAEPIVKPYLRHAAFLAWWKELVRAGAVIPEAGKFRKRVA